MHLAETGLLISPTDLAGHHGCAHLTQLDRAALGHGGGRDDATDSMMELLSRRGDDHERRHLEALRAAGLSIAEIPRPPYEPEALEAAQALTVEAMRSGADVIYQATFLHGGHAGFADFLRRVEQPSDLGAHSYEVHDTKLTAHVKVDAILQVCEYSTHVARIQGVMPRDVVLVLGDGRHERLRVADHIAYYRAARARLDRDLAQRPATTPEPCAHCVACRWVSSCQARWRDEDALVLVAGITRAQRDTLRQAGIHTMARLAVSEGPIAQMSSGSLTRLRQQARLQVEERTSGEPQVELLDPGDGHGLASLPQPSSGDLFFDIEGDPLWPDGGLEYLLGVVGLGEGDPPFLALWAHDRDEEKLSFEGFIDRVVERRGQDPAMHVYHYASYEVTAIKKLAARHATRETEVDELLRAGVFVDLLTVVRHGIRASKENYSLKSIEKFFMPHRDGDVKDAGTSVVEYERWMADGDATVLQSIEDYNRFDCIATEQLRVWLERLRADAEQKWGRTLPRPDAVDGRAPEKVLADESETALLAAPLFDTDAVDARVPGHGEARALLGHLLSFHRREDRSQWWEYFAHHELTLDELTEDADSIGNVSHGGWLRPEKRSAVHRFTFDPEQEHRIRVGHAVIDPTREAFANQVGEVIEIGHGYVDIKVHGKVVVEEVQALYPWSAVSPAALVSALRRVAGWVAAHGIDAPGEHRAARDLLLRRPPRTLQMTAVGDLRLPGESAGDAAVRLIADRDGGTLAIQGPPGSGKTYHAARMAVEVLRRPGACIGIAAPTNRAAAHLLKEVLAACAGAGVPVSAVQKSSDPDAQVMHDDVLQVTENKDVVAALDGGARIAVGTAWLFAAEGMTNRLDVLFVDEAGQMSLANTLAAASAAENLVLLGDPQQLPQVLNGSHPHGAAASALGHLIGEHRTIGPDLGLFLDVTWRMHPAVCGLVSELFYDDRLQSQPDCAQQDVDGEAGLRFVPVVHRGCVGRSDEEVAVVASIVAGLVGRARWTDRDGVAATVSASDVLVVTPFNAQVEALREVLPDGVEVGTVDKFQGREAAVVVYSMACSTVDDAPRGVDFLYELNRLNVALSRAKAVAIVVASPLLLDATCGHPRQVPRVNALCRFAEVAAWATAAAPLVSGRRGGPVNSAPARE